MATFVIFAVMERGLSILIPTYNYAISELVERLSSEAMNCAETVEIIVVDDASSLPIPENTKIIELPNVNYITLKNNMGRTAARHFLAEKATYTTLLFLDADVFPVYPDFLKRYLKHLEVTGVIFGGITYKKERPNADEILRWVYGHERETLSVAQRNKAIYTSINSGCFFTDKETFNLVSKAIQRKAYGMDILFKKKLEEYKIPVLHIDNPVYHLGLESNEHFLKKSLESVATTVALEKKGALTTDLRKIQKVYLTLKKWRLLSLFQIYFRTIATKVKRNLLSEKPSMRGLDLYRLHYYIQLKRDKSA